MKKFFLFAALCGFPVAADAASLPLPAGFTASSPIDDDLTDGGLYYRVLVNANLDTLYAFYDANDDLYSVNFTYDDQEPLPPPSQPGSPPYTPPEYPTLPLVPRLNFGFTGYPPSWSSTENVHIVKRKLTQNGLTWTEFASYDSTVSAYVVFAAGLGG